MKTSKLMIVAAALLALFSTITASAAKKQLEPDFAFPEKVITDSGKALHKALKNHDNQGVVRAIINSCIAENSIDSENATGVLAKIDSVLNMASDPTLRAMLNALEARLLTDIYTDRRRVYDERILPPDSISTDIYLWSGAQFKKKILEKVDASLSDSDALKRCPITAYKNNIELDKDDTVYFPTLYDFIACQAIERINTIAVGSSYTYLRYLSPASQFTAAFRITPKINPLSFYSDKVLGIYSSMLELHADDAAAFIRTDISRLGYVLDHLYQNEFDKARADYVSVLKNLYEQYRDNPFSGDILIALYNFNLNAYRNTEWLALIDNQIERFPSYINIDKLRDIRNSITQKSMLVQMDETVPVGQPVKIQVNLTNVNNAKISIYNVSHLNLNDRRNSLGDTISKMIPIAILPVTSFSTVPFADRKELEFTFPAYGRYAVVPTFEGCDKNDDPKIVHVSSIIAASRAIGGHSQLLVLDRVSGFPLSNVSVYYYDRNNKETLLGHTGVSGFFNVPDSVNSYRNFRIAKGDDLYSREFNMPWSRPLDKDATPKCTFFTSLPIYHPGDSVQWAAEVYTLSEIVDNTVSPDFKIKVELRDVNYQVVDTLTAITDSYGRIRGSFLIPKDRLTGYYNLRAYINSRTIGSTSVMVSDYTAPTFKVTLSPVENNAPQVGDVTVSGNVCTYSGFKLGDTPVSVRLMNVAPFYYYRNGGLPYDMTFYTDSVTTDRNGNFSIVISKSVFESALLPGGMFIAEVTATSGDGESQSASTYFINKKSYQLSLSTDNLSIEAPRNIEVPVEVRDSKNEVVALPLAYTMTLGIDTVVNGKALPQEKTISTADLASGSYKVTVYPLDKSLGNSVDFNVVIFRLTDTKSPVSTSLVWSPTGNEVKVDEARKFEWIFATDTPLEIHYAVADIANFIDTGTIKAHAGFNRWTYYVPDSLEMCKIDFVAIKANKSFNSTIEVKAPAKLPAIRIKAESFHDRVIPSSSETWTFSVVDAKGDTREATVMMRMYNAALDAVHSSSWNFPMQFKYIRLNTWFSSNNQIFCSSRTSGNYFLSGLDYQAPVFNTYGESLFGRRLRTRMLRTSMKSSKADMNDMADVVEMSYASSAGYSEMEVVRETMDEGADEVVDEATTDSFEYRTAEVPLAFFRPMLLTDADGKLNVTFTVPNSNTTWRVNAIAFTKNLQNAEFDASVIASKPVMVKPQVPKFVRNGDTVEVKALVMNETDSTAVVTTFIEIFNPADNSIHSRINHVDTIPGKGSVTVSGTFTAEGDTDLLGYRVKSSTRLFADGEQDVIPVLPSTTPVIETAPFYLAPGQADFSMPVTNKDGKARITLQFTENPAWYVVSALPGLLSTDCSTSIDVSASLFSAAVSDGIIRSNPAIETYLQDWLKSDRSDSTFISMLDRNPDLKIMLLEATPWMLDAKNDTERMTRLALLLDKNEINKVFEANISRLKLLAQNDGGIAWTENFSSSEWATANFLMLMGRLNSLGYLPADSQLTGIISRALDYLDRKVAESLKKYPEAVYPSYSLILSMFPDHKIPAEAKTAVDNTLTKILDSWKAGSITEKAVNATILHRYGKTSEARTILNSIREFAKSSPQKGMWWPSLGQSNCQWSLNAPAATATILDAFDEIEPSCKETEQIRQWLILQKEATDWRQSVSTAIVVASILKSSSHWLKPAGDVDITIGSTQVVPESVEKATGYFRTDISGLVGDKSTLDIRRTNPEAASWGAVYSQFVAEATDVAESSIDGLRISKQILKYDGSTVKSASELKVGDKIQVQLTIVSDRNIDYVAIDDARAACFTPVEQTPRPIFSQGLYFYRENRSDRTRLFVSRLPQGRYILTYDLYVTNAGTYSSGIATLQSQYAPELTAHSAGKRLKVVND